MYSTSFLLFIVSFSGGRTWQLFVWKVGGVPHGWKHVPLRFNNSTNQQINILPYTELSRF